MIRKLRRKFVVINMLLVTLVLLIVFCAQYFSTAQRLEQESLEALRRAAERAGSEQADKFPFGGKPDMPHDVMQANFIPVFSALVQEDGSIELFTNRLEVAQSTAEEAVRQAMETELESGVLSKLGVRFLVRETPDGVKIAFADLSSERASLRNQALTSLLVGIGGLLAFLVISIFLANLALGPTERAWRQQKQFVADASHELKTPLTVILANTNILLSHPQDTIAQQQKWISHTRDEAERMKKLVDDMLFLARSDAAPQESCFESLDLSDAVWSCLLPFEPIAFERQVTLESEIAEHLMISGDLGQIKQLMLILLDNACKYADAGGTIRCSLERVQEHIVLRVQNSGEPIPAEELPHIFERFYRADKSRARKQEIGQGGYGLGLAIAARIAQAHRGKIAAESNAAVGTVITVTLPRGK